MKCLVLAGGFDQIGLIKELKKRNIKVILLDYFVNPPAKGYADKHYVESTLDISKVKEVAIKENVDLITTACTDQALLTVAKVSEELELPCYITYETALNVTNKLFMKEKFISCGIPTAKYIIQDKVDCDNIGEFKFPIVVKPVDCNSSKGVKKVFNKEELQNAIHDAINFSRTRTAIVEEFKIGDEISVDVYVENGIAKVLSMTESTKAKMNSTGFTIVQSKYPVAITEVQEKKIAEIAQKISEEFGIYNSPMLIQLIVGENEINVLEFSARMGGGTKYKLIQTISGVNIMEKYVDLILGDKPSVEPVKCVNYAYLNYCYCNKGIIDKLVNFNELREENTITDYFQYKTQGMKIEKAEISSDRVAGYLLVGNTLEEIYYKQNIAEKELKVLTEEGNDIMLKGFY